MAPSRTLLVCCSALVALAGCKRTDSAPAPASSASASASAVPSVAVPALSAARTVIAERPAYRLPLPIRAQSEGAPAKRYASLSSAACKAELAGRLLPTRAARGKTAGIETPLRLEGPLHGVRFELPRTVYGVLDCRLALLLDDLTQELAALNVAVAIVNNTYRPGSVLPTNAGAPAKAKKPTQRAAAKRVARAEVRLSQHARGLAIDITEFHLADGTILNVERDWHGKRGEPPCGPESRVEPPDPAAIQLRDLACAIGRAGYCNHWITPNRDEAHFNHLHCDIEANANEVKVY